MPKGKINWVKWGVIINAIMLLVLFLTVFNVDLSLPSYPKPEYSITTLEQPFPLYPEKRPPLNCSPLYYTEIIVEKPNSVYYGDNLEISVIMKNRGKKPVKDPKLAIIIVDAIGNLRGIYPSDIFNVTNRNSTYTLGDHEKFQEESLNKGINFCFEMPPEDQKVIGGWKIFTYIYDRNSDCLVSYNVCEFDVQEKAGKLAQDIFIYSMGILLLLLFSIKKFFKIDPIEIIIEKTLDRIFKE